jgi:hypothetical protein
MSLDDPNVSKDRETPAAPSPATPAPPKPTPPPPAAPAQAQIPEQIQDFDALIKKDVQNFVNLGEKIGGEVAEQVSLVRTMVVYVWCLTVTYSPKQFCKPSRPSAPTFTSPRWPKSPSLSLRS